MRESPLLLLSPLAPAECAERLRARLDESLPRFFPRAKPRAILGVVGHVSGPLVHLRPRMAYSTATVWLTGTLTERSAQAGGGTLLRVEILFDPLVHVGGRVFACLFILLLLVGLVPTLLAGRWWLAGALALAIPWIYFGLRMQERFGRAQERALRDFVVRALEAHPVHPVSQP